MLESCLGSAQWAKGEFAVGAAAAARSDRRGLWRSCQQQLEIWGASELLYEQGARQLKRTHLFSVDSLKQTVDCEGSVSNAQRWDARSGECYLRIAKANSFAFSEASTTKI